MIRVLLPTLLASVLGAVSAAAQPMTIYPGYQGAPDAYDHDGSLARPRNSAVRYSSPDHVRRADPRYIAPQRAYRGAHPIERPRSQMGGGFIEFLFGDSRPVRLDEPLNEPRAVRPHPQEPEWRDRRAVRHARLHRGAPAGPPPMDPRFLPQVVPYSGTEKPGTVVIDTAQRFLFLVQDDGTARRYGVGVGREGFGWRGTETISAKREWPDWRPPPEMLKREPDLPRHMPGGPNNPLGARALYLGSTLYRIHGSNEPWTIGQAVSSGCIRMRNEDVEDLYERVRIGTQVKVI